MEKYEETNLKKEDEEQKEDKINWEEYDKLADEVQKNNTKLELIYQTRSFDTLKLRTEILDKKSQGGLTGLNNLGNTCFMNSAIQCLSNTEDLTYYFLSGKFKDDININNKHGLRGKLANAWKDLLDDMWMGNRRSTSPSELKYTISRIASQFSGYSQQDSQELLTFLIDGIHEDLNRITHKPYREIKEKESNETDDEAAFRFWELHRERNDSILVDLFHGQFKSTITCPECYRVSTTFDPFTSLSLPIPKLKKVDLFYVPKTNIRKTTKLSIFISEDSLFFDIHDYIQQHLDIKIGKFRCMLVANNKFFKLPSPSENIMKCLDKGFIFCCEINEKIPNIAPIPIHIEDTKSNVFKTYPRLLSTGEKMTLNDLRVIIYGFSRRFFRIPDSCNSNFGEKVDRIIKEYTEVNKDFDDEDYTELIKEEYQMLFEPEKNSASAISDEMRKEIIQSYPARFYFFDERSESKLVILDKEFYFDKTNSDEEMTRLISDKLDKISLKEAESGKKFSYNFSNSPIESYFNLIKSNDLKLIFQIDFELLDQNMKKSLTACRSIAVQEKSKALNLYDCLNHFKLTEKLDKNNEWYCSVCKKHQKAFKKLEMYYMPKNLILHLKRFEYSSVGRYRTYAEKIGSLIDFPLEDLDLKNFIIGPHNEENKYNLYAISQHYGGVGGGHYTACCKNNGKWYDYNDSSVSSSNPDSVVSSSAYMLFYRRKDV